MIYIYIIGFIFLAVCGSVGHHEEIRDDFYYNGEHYYKTDDIIHKY